MQLHSGRSIPSSSNTLAMDLSQYDALTRQLAQLTTSLQQLQTQLAVVQIEVAVTLVENRVIAARLNTLDQTSYSTEAENFEASINRPYRLPQGD